MKLTSASETLRRNAKACASKSRQDSFDNDPEEDGGDDDDTKSFNIPKRGGRKSIQVVGKKGSDENVFENRTIFSGPSASNVSMLERQNNRKMSESRALSNTPGTSKDPTSVEKLEAKIERKTAKGAPKLTENANLLTASEPNRKILPKDVPMNIQSPVENKSLLNDSSASSATIAQMEHKNVQLSKDRETPESSEHQKASDAEQTRRESKLPLQTVRASKTEKSAARIQFFWGGAKKIVPVVKKASPKKIKYPS